MKAKIELTPYDALAIYSFLREYINESTQDDQEFTAINNAVNAYEKEINDKITYEQLTDALAENEVNKLLKKCPSNSPSDQTKT